MNVLVTWIPKMKRNFLYPLQLPFSLESIPRKCVTHSIRWEHPFDSFQLRFNSTVFSLLPIRNWIVHVSIQNLNVDGYRQILLPQIVHELATFLRCYAMLDPILRTTTHLSSFHSSHYIVSNNIQMSADPSLPNLRDAPNPTQTNLVTPRERFCRRC